MLQQKLKGVSRETGETAKWTLGSDERAVKSEPQQRVSQQCETKADCRPRQNPDYEIPGRFTFIAQWTEHRSSKAGIEVRFLIGVHVCGGMADTTVLETVELCSMEVRVLSHIPAEDTGSTPVG